MTYAVIPARKGSKRIPNKNYKEFCGKAMVTRAASCFDRRCPAICQIHDKLIISNDDNRPEHLCNDEAGLLDVMAFYTRGKPDKLTYVCLLPCTPLLQPETLNNAITAYERFYAATDEMLVSVCEYAHPVGRAMWIDPDGLFMDNPTWATSNTQECNTLYHDAGQFYIATAKRWRSGEPILSDGAKPWLLPRWEAVDIDTPEDWRMAELIYKGMEAEQCD